MAKTTIWMPWYPGDYLRDTITLTLEEDCLYRRAIDFLWQNPKGLPRETHRLCSGLRVDKPTLERLSWVLEEYLVTDGDYYRHPRVDMEYAKAVHNNGIQQKNGRLGGRPPKAKENPRVNPTDKPNETPSPSPSDGKKEKAIAFSSSEPVRLAGLLFDLMRKNDPKAKEPSLDRWAIHIDRLMRIDNRSVSEIEAVLRWSQADAFWRANIHSTEKLREQFVKLKLKMEAQHGAATNRPQGPRPHKLDGNTEQRRDLAQRIARLTASPGG